MIQHVRTLCLCSVAMPLALWSMAAHAQEAAPAAQAAGSEQTETLRAEDDGGIEEIVVTAQRRQEPLQSVPVAASVIGGELFARSGNLSIEELEKYSPSLTFDSTTSARNNSVRIRGIGTNTTSSGIEPQTSTVVDGVVLVRSGQSSASQLLDLSRIEVLRGPQGTLFGKNASAGVVNIISQNPGREFELSGDILATDDREYQVRAVASGPLGPKVSARVAGFYRDYDGNARNVRDGDRLNGAESYGARAKLLFKPTDGFSALLTLSYGKQDSNCCARPIRVLDLAGSPRAAVELPFLRPVVPGLENTQVNNDTRAQDNSESFIGSIELNKEVGEFTLTSITAYQGFKIDQRLDDDLTSSRALVGGQTFEQEITSNEAVDGYTQEFRVTSPEWESFDFVAGAYALYAKVDQTSDNIRRRVAVPQNQLSSFRSVTEFTNFAVFGQANLHLTPKLTALLGARFTHDKVTNDYARVDDPLAPFRGGNLSYSLKQNKSNLSGKAGVEYEFSQAVFTYATYARGYKGPGFNVASNGTLADPPVRSEDSNSYEIGTKLRLFNRRLVFNVAAFDATYKNFAITAIDPITSSVRLLNAAELGTRGVEIDFDARPFKNFSLSGAVAYVDAKFDVGAIPCFTFQTVAQGCANTTPRSQAIKGGEVPNSPNWKFSLNSSYTIDGAALPFDIVLQGGLVYTGRQQLLLSQDPLGRIGAYTLLDASVAFVSKDDKLRAELFVENITDEFYSNGIGLVSDLTGSTFQFVPRDGRRYFGVRLSARY